MASFFKCGCYTGSVATNEDLVQTLKARNPKITSIKGITMICDTQVVIEIGENSELMTMENNGTYVLNINYGFEGIGTYITKMIFDTGCEIKSLNYYYN